MTIPLKILTVISGTVLFLSGCVVAVLGIRLALLGGSSYYAGYGSLMILCGAWLPRRPGRATLICLLAYFVTIAWAVTEVGFRFWPLFPRILLPTILLILCLLTSAISGTARRVSWIGVSVLTIAVVLATGTTLIPQDVRYGLPGRAYAQTKAADDGDWRAYGRTADGTRFSTLADITPANVGQLKEVWRFRTDDHDVADLAEDENTPLKIGTTVFTCTPHNVVHAIDAETGQRRWTFDPVTPRNHINIFRCRGVGYVKAAAAGTCAERIILSTSDARLIAIDAKTGKPCADFGEGGTVDLRDGLGDVKANYYYTTSAPTIARNRIVVGAAVLDGETVDVPSGVIRAYDVRTGRLVWAWDMGAPNASGAPAPKTIYTRGTPNMWSTPSVDEQLGVIFLPIGNATPDFVAEHRKPEWQKYASSTVAVDISTGRPRWSFQTAHRDVWDYDVPSQPALYDLPLGTAKLPVLIQTTKSGQIYMLDRRNGRPIAPVVERSVSRRGGIDPKLSLTQPFSVGMPAIGTEPLSETRMWGVTMFDHLLCRIAFREARYDGMYTPPGLDRSIQYPGYYGGMNWGSVSIDKMRGYLIVNDIRMPHLVRLIPRIALNRARGRNANTLHEGVSPQLGTSYAVEKANMVSVLKVPCQEPPYGTMTAIDLRTRKIVWQVPMGTLRDVRVAGIKLNLPIPLGMPTMGGSMTTATGLTFFAGTQDNYLRALDTNTGRQLWAGRLPIGSQGTPIAYRSPASGRQFILISAGGARQSSDKGYNIIAYALPRT